MAHLRFLVHCLFLISRLVAAGDVRVLGNDRSVLAGGGSWSYAADICPQAGFLATTTRGAFATLLFQGTAISVSLLTVFNGGLATVYLDDVPLATDVDLLDPGGQSYQCTTKSINATDLRDTAHNVTIVHAGRSPHALTGQADWLVLIEMIYTTSNVTSSSTSASSSRTSSTTTIPLSTTTPLSTTMSSSTTTSTANEPTSSSSPGSNSAMIGGIVGGVLGGLLLGVGIAFYCFRQRQPTAEPVTHLQPGNGGRFTIDQPPGMATTGISPWNPYSASAGTTPSSSDPASSVAATPYHIYPSAPAIPLGDVDPESLPPPPRYDYKRAPGRRAARP